jgi:hypothetical protein
MHMHLAGPRSRLTPEYSINNTPDTSTVKPRTLTYYASSDCGSIAFRSDDFLAFLLRSPVVGGHAAAQRVKSYHSNPDPPSTDVELLIDLARVLQR